MLTQILTAVSITLSILGAILAVSTLVVRYHSSERPDDDEPDDDEPDEEADECDEVICEKLEAILHLLEEINDRLPKENQERAMESERERE